MRCRVSFVGGARIAGGVAVDGGMPLHLACDRARVRVEQELRRVAADAVSGCPRPVHAEAVVLAGREVGDVALPDEALSLFEAPARLNFVIEQTQLDLFGDAAEEREARAVAVVVRAERRCGGWLEHGA